ncbi:MAG: TrkA C-terminal domain-containing protein [Bacteroidales bacterium]
MDLLQNSYFMLFLIITIGFLLGAIKIKGVSLGASAVIFVAMLFGHFGVVVSKDIENFGMMIFIFTIGMQAGPGFIEAFRSKGRDLILLTVILTGIIGICGLIMGFGMGYDKATISGLLAGAITSTPGLAAATEITNSPLASIAYGISYPFGVIGVIIFVKLIPKFIHTDIKALEEKLSKEENELYPLLENRIFRVENDNIINKSLAELKLRTMTGANIYRIRRDDEFDMPSPCATLELGDLIKVVGPKEALDQVAMIIGPEVSGELPLAEDYDQKTILLTNKKLIGKTIGSLDLWNNFHAIITHIGRCNVEIIPNSNIELHFSDKINIIAKKSDLKNVSVLFGNDEKALSETDFFPVAAGIVLGILFGKLNLGFGSGFSFSPGLIGGVLIIAIVLSSIGKTGPILWSMTDSANSLLKQLGLILFLAGIGTSAGQHIVSTFEEYGISLFLLGVALTLIPMILTTIIGYKFFKMNILYLLGAVTGAMTSTPGLAAVDTMTKSNVPTLAYATVYPIATVLFIILIQLLCGIL